ncbi:hypothetical protein HK105_206443 [Polyrhizophydium stewartii]|uniref:Uncharacterized protein n=1 Tax=Polyrhizophydium stewartii TaxID=2732419 RepID=A0ABR4N3E2_9FUNG
MRLRLLRLSHTTTIGTLTARTGCGWIDLARSDPRFLLAARTDRSISVYDLDDQSELFNNMRSVRRAAVISSGLAHAARISAVQWFPGDTGLFVSASLDRTVKVWDSATLQAAFTFRLEEQVLAMHMSPAASSHALIATATESPQIRLCDMKSGALTHSLAGHAGHPAALQWSPAHDFLLASGGADGFVRFWDIRKANACIWAVQHARGSGPAPASQSRTFGKYMVNGLAFTSDGLQIASMAHDERLQLWNVQSGDNAGVSFGPHFRNRTGMTMRMDITPGETVQRPLLVCPSDARHVLVFDLWTGDLVRRLSAHLGRVACVAVRPDTQALVSAGPDDPLVLWEPGPAASAAAEAGAVAATGTTTWRADADSDFMRHQHQQRLAAPARTPAGAAAMAADTAGADADADAWSDDDGGDG